VAGKPLKLLQVEDSETDALLIVRALEGAGYVVGAARVEDAGEMRDALAAQSWDVVVADYQLPGFDAPAALSVLRQSGLDIPFIVVSGAVGEDRAVALMKAGAHDYVMKNSLARLAPAVEREIQDAEVRRQRRLAEQALRESHAREAARASELQAFMDAMPVAAFIARDAQCREIGGNAAAYQLLHLPQGSNIAESLPAGPAPAFRLTRNGSDLTVEDLPLQKAVATGQAVRNAELGLLFQDGACRHLVGNAVPLLSGDGVPQGAVGVFVDITDLRLAEEALRNKHKLESIGLLAGGVAHDFNNVLTVIMGSASAALQECPSCEHSKAIVGAAERAAHLTRQLLAYAGKGHFVVKTFDLGDHVSNTRPLLAASIPKRVSLRFYLTAEPAPLEADPTHIEQILMNLVINAGEAIQPKTDGWIEVHTRVCDLTTERLPHRSQVFEPEPGRFVCLEVNDNGAGMDKPMLARIFDPFFSTKFTGRGMGLAAVQGIVRAAKGFIEVDSAPGCGSTFRVFLPAAGRQVSRESAGAGIPATAAVPLPATSATVLVVDDEEMVRKLACMMLRRQGYGVLEAGDGKEALRVLATSSALPSVVLLDLAMPVMGGDELLPVLAERYPTVKTIVSSGYPEEEARKDFPAHSIAGFLPKPYTAQALAAKIRDLVGTADQQAPGLVRIDERRTSRNPDE